MCFLLACVVMAPHRRCALPEPVLDVTPEESHEEVPPQSNAVPVGDFDQFMDALWTNSQQKFTQQHLDQPQ